jgi:hypothetical protein
MNSPPRRNPWQQMAAVILGCALGASFAPPSTQKSHDTQSGIGEILAIHQNDRRAHFAGDAALLIPKDATEILNVQDGKITPTTPDQMRKEFVEYFRNSEYSAWDDLEPPQVHVSPDEQMAWMAVRVHSKFVRTLSDGKKEPHEFVAAWTSTYEKLNGKWQMTSVTSTLQP